MGIALLNPSYKIARVGWVERSDTHHHVNGERCI